MTFSTSEMIAEIERIVSFGIRRPGYKEGLNTEQYLLDRLLLFLLTIPLYLIQMHKMRFMPTALGICGGSAGIR